MVTFLGTGQDLTYGQIALRAILVFLYTLILLRISGRRSFGMRAPIDNIILILLGALLSRAVIGASPFFTTLFSGLVICVMHRILAYLSIKSPKIDRWIKGGKYTLYERGKFHSRNMTRSLVDKEDLMEGLRLRACVDSLEEVKAIYMEKNGEISAVKK